MKLLTMIMLAAMAALFAGCGHNVAVATKGIGVRLAWMPDSMMPELSLGYFETGAAVIRDKASFSYKSDSLGALGDQQPASATGNIGTSMTLKTGAQANGYLVKIAEADKELARLLFDTQEQEGLAAATPPDDEAAE